MGDQRSGSGPGVGVFLRLLLILSVWCLERPAPFVVDMGYAQHRHLSWVDAVDAMNSPPWCGDGLGESPMEGIIGRGRGWDEMSLCTGVSVRQWREGLLEYLGGEKPDTES